MRLSWNEIRTRAADFAEEWKAARYEKGESQTFYNEFFEIFGLKRKRVASFEEPVKRLGDKRGFIDLFWKGVLIVEQKSAGKNLITAKAQALDYFPGLKEYELPRYILVSDFQIFELYDLETGEEAKFPLSLLPQNVEKFSFVLGIEKKTFKDQDPANILAAELMGKLHDALEEAGYQGHNLERFLVRILFCLFADDTGIFEPRDIFLALIKERTSEDGADLGMWLSMLFEESLNKEEFSRQKSLDEDLKQFPHINGDLFAEKLPIPAFDRKMREILIEACEFDWSAISPAIFGSLFQSVMDKQERRAQGAHYTTEKNIMKVIQPLFLNDLRTEFETLRARKTDKRRLLEAFHDRLGKMKFFDPACGCGNFLVIAYRELRFLELDILKELFAEKQEKQASLDFDVSAISAIVTFSFSVSIGFSNSETFNVSCAIFFDFDGIKNITNSNNIIAPARKYGCHVSSGYLTPQCWQAMFEETS